MNAINTSRRAFLRRAATLSVAGPATSWMLNLAALTEASAATAADYKAIVCVCMHGGNDYANTVIPYDAPSYTLYQQLRPALAFSRDSLMPTVLKPSTVPVDVGGGLREYALAPALSSFLPIFDAGRMAVVLNIGAMVQPTTKFQYMNKSVPLPSKLFSHNDQASVWQSSAPEGAPRGWGGRMGDLFEAGNGNATFTCVSVSGNAVFLSGQEAVQYQVSPDGAIPIAGLANPLFGSAACSEALRTLVSQPRQHLFEDEYNRVVRRSIAAESTLTGALAGAPAIATTFPATSLGDQLKMVARMIGNASALGARRQVFFVSLGGFDTHTNVLTIHAELLKSLGDAVSAFFQATVELGVADRVTTFTTSEFGRTLTANANAGSDHGWGGVHFVLGGAVNGQRFYGTPPVVANNGPDDVGQGRLLPTTSVDQYAATLGAWLGVSDTELLSLLPNLKNYDPGVRNLGFLS